MDNSVRFDLEQGIMNAWNVVEDLKLAAEFANEPKIVELLNSMACLYQFRFEKCFSLFEQYIQEHRYNDW